MTDRDVGRAEPAYDGAFAGAMAEVRNEHPIRKTFDELAFLVDGKAHDYADSGNVFSNFEGAAKLTGLTVEQVFHVMIAIKQERLRQLMSGKEANFEGIEDTLMDLANYTALWLTYRRMLPKFNFEEPVDSGPYLR